MDSASPPPPPPAMISLPSFAIQQPVRVRVAAPAPVPVVIPSNTPMRFPSSQMDVYGLQPVRDVQMLVVCKLCRKPLLIAAFATHFESCSRAPPPSQPHPQPQPSSSSSSSSVVFVSSAASSVVSVRVPSSNAPPLSSTRIGATSTQKARAPPTPPRLLKVKKKPSKKKPGTSDEEDEFRGGGDDDDDDNDDAGAGEEEQEQHDVDEDENGEEIVPVAHLRQQQQRVTVGRKTVSRPVAAVMTRMPPVPPQMAMRRKEISVLEIKKDDDSEGKVTIMVETGTPVLTRANRSGGVPLASRRWTRRNRLTGLSLSFKIRSDNDDCEQDEDDDDDHLHYNYSHNGVGDEEEDRYAARQGGDLSQGWAYTSERKRQGSPRSELDERHLSSGSKRKAVSDGTLGNGNANGTGRRLGGNGVFVDDHRK